MIRLFVFSPVYPLSTATEIRSVGLLNASPLLVAHRAGLFFSIDEMSRHPGSRVKVVLHRKTPCLITICHDGSGAYYRVRQAGTNLEYCRFSRMVIHHV